MGKRLLLHTILGLLIGGICFGVHQATVSALEVEHPFALGNIYLFFGIFSIVICIAFELLASMSKEYGDQLGFIYMVTMALKMVLFCVIFRTMLFSGPAFAKTDSLTLLIVIFIFLSYEVYIIAKILNRTL